MSQDTRTDRPFGDVIADLVEQSNRERKARGLPTLDISVIISEAHAKGLLDEKAFTEWLFKKAMEGKQPGSRRPNPEVIDDGF